MNIDNIIREQLRYTLNETEFSELYYAPQDGEMVPVRLFYPTYYRSMSTRLYNFDGKAVTADKVLVIDFKEMAGRDGRTEKVITTAKNFSSYEEAISYLSTQNSDNIRIVSDNPFISPVPLEALNGYKLVYSSDNSTEYPPSGETDVVKVFQYTGP